ncbi:transposase [Streptomyces rubiginosohelvolus]|uniref:transposase n=1 Tax=Streptomyces rubiginosohelvolus TaxID=67362 RepID=UPI00381FF40A
MGQAPPPGPRRTRCPRRAGLVTVRDRLGEHARPEKGDLTGPNPVDRGKYGSKIHLITERSGLPISIGISGANLHDSQALIPLVKGIPPIRSRRGPRRRKPAKLHADKGYDYVHLRRWLRQRGITHRNRPQGNRVLATAGPPPLDRRTHHGLARRLPPPTPTLRTQSRPLPRLHQHRLHSHLLPPAHQMRWLLSRMAEGAPGRAEVRAGNRP